MNVENTFPRNETKSSDKELLFSGLMLYALFILFIFASHVSAMCLSVSTLKPAYSISNKIFLLIRSTNSLSDAF